MQMNKQPLVSVVIPCYNHESFVQDSIQSVIDQTYENIELIIIDDGSKDSSVEKIQEMLTLCEKRFTRFEFRHRPNKGLSATLNEALEWCEGEFYSAIASDDLMLKDKTDIQVNYLIKNNNCNGVFGEIELINFAQSKIKKLKDIKKYDFNNIFLHYHNLPTATQMLRLKTIKKLGGYNDLILLEDWYINLKLTESGETLDYIPYVLAKYRRHGNNLSSKFELIHQGRLDIIELYRNNLLYNAAKARAYMVTANSLQLINKKKSLYYWFTALRIAPIYFLSTDFFKYLIKSLISKKRLKNFYGEV